MKRRTIMSALGGASLWSVSAYGQSNLEAPKVGFVYPGPKQFAATRIEAIVGGLRASGNPLPQVEMVVRVAEGDAAKIEPMVAEVIDKKVSVFVAPGPAVLRAAKAATKTLPIIAYDFETDPIADKYAESIARPGGNVTGIFLDFPNFAGKWIEILRECISQLSRIAMLWEPSTGRVQVDAIAKTTGELNIQTALLEVKVRADFAGAFAVAKDRGASAVIILSSPLVPPNVKELAELSLRYKLPAITLFSEFARTGGLFSYGPNLLGASKQAGVLAGKVLLGASPASLPIERPTNFELIVNQHTAEALGIAIPASIQVRADEVIE